MYYVDENFVRVVNVTGTYDFTYVKHEGQLVAQLNPGGSKYFMHSDHEGSTSVITNSTGQVIENTTYSPHGEILGGGSLSRFDSEGKEFSSVTGDTDFHFRKMNPSWGLFLQPDTLIPNVYDPQSLNRYMFERGNPYKNVDKDGHVGMLAALGVLAVGVVVLAFAITFLVSELTRPLAVAAISKDIRDEKEYNKLYKEAKQLNPNIEDAYVSTVTGTERRYNIKELEKMKEGISPKYVNIPGYSNPYDQIQSPNGFGKPATSVSGSAYGSSDRNVRRTTGQAAAAARRAAESARSKK
ncbi:MAG: RHS repeat-associated core domain-containing protein [Nanoarchaeota archaeon]|nr:RHS repeat-associated core domain-containing protein [Nanoarchaeota archaeon]